MINYKNVILISGKAGAGKSTLAKGLVEMGLVTETIKFADPLYAAGHAAWASFQRFQVVGKSETLDKTILQLLGTEWGRKRSQQIWVDSMVRRVSVRHLSKPELKICIDDLRFRNEFDAFDQCFSVRLVCSEELRKPRCDSWRENTTHPSEVDLDNYTDRFSLVLDTGVLSKEKVLAQVSKAWKKHYS